ncbi:hypothetical protein [Neisseria animalis]|uniref:hypothetical protein n=1 Tax=Neisseria animalis TaxID=492 RepID=UPI0013BE8F35|nr:hypothetical protein [Neisseria animalis]
MITATAVSTCIAERPPRTDKTAHNTMKNADGIHRKASSPQPRRPVRRLAPSAKPILK